jgi:exosortase D (VPLPA-CTERM-specific)
MSDPLSSRRVVDSRPVFRLTPLAWILLGAAVSAAIGSVKSGIAVMVSSFMRPEHSHAIMIPFIAAFLVWQRRDQIERMPFIGSWAGFLLVLFGVTLGAIGTMATLFALEQYSVLIVLYGVLLALTGLRVFKLVWVPLLILILMVPLPGFLYQNFSAALQLMSSQIGVWFMRLFGVSVYLEGNVIDLGVYKLQVAEACDGLRYLFPLMTIGFLIAYFFKAALWKRALLFLSSIPISILMNSFRVGTIGVMVEHWGVRVAEGFLHEFQGWVVFMASGALIMLEMTLLARIGEGHKPWREQFGLEFPDRTPKTPPAVARPVPVTLYASVSVLILAAAVSLSLPEHPEYIPQRSSFAQYPNTVGAWTSRREALEPIYLNVLMLDDYYLGNFTRDSEPPVSLYIAWYNSQIAGHSSHSPRSCLPGGGWQIKSLTQRTLPGVHAGREALRVNRALIQLGLQRQVVYYWFQQRGRVITNEYVVKWYLFWDALTRNRTDGALVRLVVAVPAGGTVFAADRELTEFAAAAAPTLAPFIPD